MAGRKKHMERSHRSYAKNYSQFRRHLMKAKNSNRYTEAKFSIAESFERFLNLLRMFRRPHDR